MAAFGEDDVARLMADAGIVRNRLKIEAAIANARAALDVPLAELIWSFAPDPRPPRPRDRGEGQADDARVQGAREGAEEGRLPLRRPDDRLRADAGLRARRRPLRGLPCSSGLTSGEPLSAAEALASADARRGRGRRAPVHVLQLRRDARRARRAGRVHAPARRPRRPRDAAVAARRRRRRPDRPGHRARRGLRAARRTRPARSAAARRPDLTPLRHPVGGRPVRGGRPAGAGVHVA